MIERSYLWAEILVNGWFPFCGVFPGHSSLTALVRTRAGYLDVWALQLKVRC